MAQQLPLATVIDESMKVHSLSEQQKNKKRLWTLRNSVFKRRQRVSDARGAYCRGYCRVLSRSSSSCTRGPPLITPPVAFSFACQISTTTSWCSLTRSRRTGADLCSRSGSRELSNHLRRRKSDHWRRYAAAVAVQFMGPCVGL